MEARGRRAPRFGNDLRVLAGALLAGVLVAYRCPTLVAVGAAALVALVVVAVACVWWRAVLGPALAVLSGIALLGLYAVHLQSGRLPLTLDGLTRTVEGTISSLPDAQPRRIRFRFTPADGKPARHILVSWYDVNPGRLAAGQCWRLSLKLRAPRGLRNPGGFDYAGKLFRSGIGATAYVRGAERCAADGTYFVLRLRQRLAERLNEILRDDPMAGIIQALTIGSYRGITDAQWRVLRRTGTSHLVAVSGLHIGVAATFVFWLAGWLWRRVPALALRVATQRAAAVGAIAGAVAYAALAGFSLPTQRAVIMVLVAMLGLLLDRRSVPSRLLALALIGVLVANPLAVGSAGFWLSFGAVGWLLFAFTGRLRRPGMVRGWAWSQFVLLFAIMPLTVFWFQQGSLVAPLSNLFMIPLASLLIPLLLVAVLCLPLGWPGAIAVQACAWVLGAAWRALEWLAALPLASIHAAAPPGVLVALASAGLVVLFMPRGIPGRAMGLVLCLPMLLWRPLPPAPGSAVLTVLDVGQGLAMVIRTHAHALVVDTGPSYPSGFDAGRSVVVPFLRWAGVSVPDRVVVSHADRDHSGGFEAIVQATHPRSVWGAGGEVPCRAGQHWRWDGVEFHMLSPTGREPDTTNGRSCVVRVDVGKHAILLPADIEAATEALLLARLGASELDADILVVPHHGSSTSSTAAFVDAVSPRYALVSAGHGNRWGFPRPDVVQRYQALGSLVVNTAKVGAIRVTVPARGTIPPPVGWRSEHRRLWTID